jgi:hypothetical protein
MTDPNNNELTEEEQARIREVLGDKADDYIWPADD